VQGNAAEEGARANEATKLLASLLTGSALCGRVTASGSKPAQHTPNAQVSFAEVTWALCFSYLRLAQVT